MLNRKKCSELTLGTAQLGMKYGIANTTGKPDISEAIYIVRQAIAHGVTSIDTARAYGDAETRIGEALSGGFADINIVTKLDPFDNLDSDELETNILLAVDASIFRSCNELRKQHLQTLLLHRWQHRFAYKEAIWRRLLELKKDGFIEKIGVSVYTPIEAIYALNEPEIEHIQLPFNILDWRWKAAGFPELLVQRMDVVTHARSALLQGLLAADSVAWDRVEGSDPNDWIVKLDKLVKELGRKSRADLCFAYVRSQSWITSIVVGIETRFQLDENIKIFQNTLLTDEETQKVEAELSGATEELLNPAKWRIKCLRGY